MYARILLPSDGSAMSKLAVQSGIRFARDNGAEAVGLHVVALPHAEQLDAWMHHAPQLVERRQALFDKFADEYLAFIESTAQAEQVPCRIEKIRAAEPAMAIVRTAASLGCDLIYMASHGWRGDRARMLGSETLKVLQESRVPVLVHKVPHVPGGHP
ncbi:MAG TPA: universal stress protein [Telluria sp.]|nr:universal stress protein [Telluria sp.]